ncbi:MAG: hypothetical protein M1822_003444 [Bathelium mastoideum]|nr:MAG: hypothetical protein M1822_003444 [Bathelium mastoideum]
MDIINIPKEGSQFNSSDPTPPYTVGPSPQQAEPANYGTQRITNAGQVRPANGLGPKPDIVDCTACEYPRWTKIEMVESDVTRWWRLGCAIAWCPFFCCYWAPMWRKMSNDYEHHCSKCNKYIFTFKHNGQMSHADEAPSRYPRNDEDDAWNKRWWKSNGHGMTPGQGYTEMEYTADTRQGMVTKPRPS